MHLELLFSLAMQVCADKTNYWISLSQEQTQSQVSTGQYTIYLKHCTSSSRIRCWEHRSSLRGVTPNCWFSSLRSALANAIFTEEGTRNAEGWNSQNCRTDWGLKTPPEAFFLMTRVICERPEVVTGRKSAAAYLSRGVYEVEPIPQQRCLQSRGSTRRRRRTSLRGTLREAHGKSVVALLPWSLKFKCVMK